jgi:predicted transcriptional regulator
MVNSAPDTKRDFTGTDLRTWREQANLSRRALAERAGCCQTTLVNMEGGCLPKRSFVLPRIVAVLDEALEGRGAVADG